MTPSPRDIASVQTLPQLLAYRVASTPEGEAYRAFRGRDPDVKYIMKKRGFPTGE